MDFLKDDLMYVNVFVLTFKEADKRLTLGLQSMMKLLGRMFGSQFWKFSVICGTQWGYDTRYYISTSTLQFCIHSSTNIKLEIAFDIQSFDN